MTVLFESEVAGFKSYKLLGLENWLETVAGKEGKKIGEIVYKFVSDDAILAINRNFLDHNYITDIITFDTSYLQLVSGEIYICIPEVKRNADRHNSPNFEHELYRVILHGLLHLLGFGDSSSTEAINMRLKEDTYLKLLEVS